MSKNAGLTDLSRKNFPTGKRKEIPEIVTATNPIKDLDQLLKFSLKSLNQYCRILPSKSCPVQRFISGRKLLVCHDMMGGYLTDINIQGSYDCSFYSFFHWHLVNIFVYFSHHLVTIPPLTWISACHSNGVNILGVFIVENDGIGDRVFSNWNICQQVACKLAEVCEFYQFDGWLLNIECCLQPPAMQNLLKFIPLLTSKCKANNSGALVIWYDAVTVNGRLSWQNCLNSYNKCFFDLCDGIFLNYNWNENTLDESLRIATLDGKIRAHNVYVGLDIFCRKCKGNRRCDHPLQRHTLLPSISSRDLSTAMFAQGYVYECMPKDNFYNNQIKYFQHFCKLTSDKPFTSLPFSTNFSLGYANSDFYNGQRVSSRSWWNLGLQSINPHYFPEDCKVESMGSHETLKMSYVYDECDGYDLGGCCSFAVSDSFNVNNHRSISCKLFDTQFLIVEGNELLVRFVIKVPLNEPPSQWRILLQFQDSDDETHFLSLKDDRTKIEESDGILQFQCDTEQEQYFSEENLRNTEWTPKIFKVWAKDGEFVSITSIWMEFEKIDGLKSEGQSVYLCKLGSLHITNYHDWSIPKSSLQCTQLSYSCIDSLATTDTSVSFSLTWKLPSNDLTKVAYWNIWLVHSKEISEDISKATLYGRSFTLGAFRICDIPKNTYGIRIQPIMTDGQRPPFKSSYLAILSQLSTKQ